MNEELSSFAIGWQTNLLAALHVVSHGEVVAPCLVVSSVCVRPETSQDVWGSMSWQVTTYVASGQSRAEMFCIVKVFFTHRRWIYLYMLECGSGKNSLAPIRLCVDVMRLLRKSLIDVFLTVCCFCVAELERVTHRLLDKGWICKITACKMKHVIFCSLK